MRPHCEALLTAVSWRGPRYFATCRRCCGCAPLHSRCRRLCPRPQAVQGAIAPRRLHPFTPTTPPSPPLHSMNTHSKLSRLSLFARARALSLSKVPIAEMEGVQEKLSNIGMITYQVASAQAMFDAVLANGEKPPGTQCTCFPKYKSTNTDRGSGRQSCQPS